MARLLARTAEDVGSNITRHRLFGNFFKCLMGIAVKRNGQGIRSKFVFKLHILITLVATPSDVGRQGDVQFCTFLNRRFGLHEVSLESY